ncbi:MAG: polysaccharide deacetylase family protein [Candidatus Accumulibacter sp.]|uniref:Polysaccharide deacetylase family protein n=1 Tax=Candidatus Accumulibacter proximus TaxID=2954385 RepID=A0A935PW46_9PROT|nr:polysaccharide deacetylase family protein [Candidatus Accumulibacter proximus]
MAGSIIFDLVASAATLISGRALSILIFHRVHPEPDPLFPREMYAARFDRLLGELVKCWCILPLATAIDKLRAGTLRDRCLSITFDDGYADNAEVAAPILKKHGASATVFVTTGYVGGGRMWNDTVIEAIRRTELSTLNVHFIKECSLRLSNLAERQQAISTIIRTIKHFPASDRLAACSEIAWACGARLPDDLMMRPEQVRALAASGIDIGAHTVTHPILATLTDDAARYEIAQGKLELEALIERPVDLFAYPNGRPEVDYLPTHVEMVKAAGFSAAVATSWGASGPTADFFQLARFTPWDEHISRFNLRLVKNLFHGWPHLPGAVSY